MGKTTAKYSLEIIVTVVASKSYLCNYLLTCLYLSKIAMSKPPHPSTPLSPDKTFKVTATPLPKYVPRLHVYMYLASNASVKSTDIVTLLEVELNKIDEIILCRDSSLHSCVHHWEKVVRSFHSNRKDWFL